MLLIIPRNDSRESNYSLKFIVLVVVAFTAKEKRQTEQQAEQTYNLLVSILVFACDSYLFCAAYMCTLIYAKSKPLT